MRWTHVLCILALVCTAGSATFAADEPYLAIFGGYGDNDDATGADNSTPWGVRFGAETPIAGGQLSATFNRDGGVKMDTLLAELLLHFGSSDARTRRNRILYNRISGFGILGLGTMRYDNGNDAAWIFAYSFGLGMQVKLTRRVGLRVQLQSTRTGPNNFSNDTADAGVAFYF